MDLFLLAFAILGLSQAAVMIRLAHAPVEVIGFWRQLIATAALAPFAWRRRSSWARLSLRERAAILLAASLFFVHLWTFTYASQTTSVAHAMIGFELHPVVTGAGALLLFGEALSTRLFLAWGLAAAGMAALMLGMTPGTTTRLGDAMAVISAVSFSGYVLLGKSARRNLDNWVFAFAMSAINCALFFGAGALRGVAWAPQPLLFWISMVLLVAFVSIGGHGIFTHLLATMDVNVLSCSKLLEPALAAVGAWLLFRERLTSWTLLAFTLVTSAVLVLLLPRRGAPPLPPADLEE